MIYNVGALDNLEQYSRGSRGFPAKEVDRVTGARVRIPLAPPRKILFATIGKFK